MTKDDLMEYLRGLVDDVRNDDTYTDAAEYRKQGKVSILEDIIEELETHEILASR